MTPAKLGLVRKDRGFGGYCSTKESLPCLVAYRPAESKRSGFEEFDRVCCGSRGLEINYHDVDYPLDFGKSDSGGRPLADEIHLRGVRVDSR